MDHFTFLIFFLSLSAIWTSRFLLSLTACGAAWAFFCSSLRYYPTIVLLSRMVGLVVFRNTSFTMMLMCCLYIRLRCRLGGDIRNTTDCYCIRNGVSSRADWQRLGSKPWVTDFVTNNKTCSFASRVLSAACPSWHAKDYTVNPDGTVTIHMGFDSCANVHYVGDKRLLRNYRSHRGLSVDGLGGNSHVRGIGDLPLTITCTDGTLHRIILPDVF